MRAPSFSFGRPASITPARTSAPPNSPSHDSATDRAPGIPCSESSSLRYDASHCALSVAEIDWPRWWHGPLLSHFRDDDALRDEAGIDRRNVNDGAQQKAGGGDEQQRQGELCRDERLFDWRPASRDGAIAGDA